MTKEITTINQELLNQIAGNMPAERSFQRLLLPRLGMYSQDQTIETKEDKGKKKIELISEAGTFYIENESEELNETGKKVWAKTDIGDIIEGVIVYYRKQLSMYDIATEKYTNSPVYDNDEDILPLFCEKKEIAKGTQAELKAKYKFIDPKDGKPKSKLQDNKILFILHKGELYQMAIKGTSMYSFSSYLRGVVPPTVLTSFNSEAKSQGTTNWNMMTFKQIRKLADNELEEVLNYQTMIRNSIKAEKDYFASINIELDSSPIKTEIEEDWTKDIADDLKAILG